MVIVVKHKDYLNLDLAQLKEQMRTPVIVDGQNAFDKARGEQAGFVYKGVGTPREKADIINDGRYSYMKLGLRR